MRRYHLTYQPEDCWNPFSCLQFRVLNASSVPLFSFKPIPWTLTVLSLRLLHFLAVKAPKPSSRKSGWGALLRYQNRKMIILTSSTISITNICELNFKLDAVNQYFQLSTHSSTHSHRSPILWKKLHRSLFPGYEFAKFIPRDCRVRAYRLFNYLPQTIDTIVAKYATLKW